MTMKTLVDFCAEVGQLYADKMEPGDSLFVIVARAQGDDMEVRCAYNMKSRNALAASIMLMLQDSINIAQQSNDLHFAEKLKEMMELVQELDLMEGMENLGERKIN